jgi:hypothetical protein
LSSDIGKSFSCSGNPRSWTGNLFSETGNCPRRRVCRGGHPVQR